MANFKTYAKRESLNGPARLAVTTTPLTPGTDPATIAAIINVSTWAFASGTWKDVGATNGGIKVTNGFAETGIKHDLSDGKFKFEVTENTMRVETELAELGDLEQFRYVWIAAQDATAVDGTTDERMKKLGARRQVPHRSLAAVNVDEADLLRVFYLRDVANVAGDATITMNSGELQTAPLNLRAFMDPTASLKEFGFILEADGYGGIVNP